MSYYDDQNEKDREYEEEREVQHQNFWMIVLTILAVALLAAKLYIEAN